MMPGALQPRAYAVHAVSPSVVTVWDDGVGPGRNRPGRDSRNREGVDDPGDAGCETKPRLDVAEPGAKATIHPHRPARVAEPAAQGRAVLGRGLQRILVSLPAPLDLGHHVE